MKRHDVDGNGPRRPVAFADEVMAALDRPPDPGLAHLDDAAIERAVRTGAAEIAAATCRWLLLVAEFVSRGIWADEGARTPTEWLSWAVSMGSSTAREHVRVALRLRRFPKVLAAFREGKLSYTKVRAITRLDDPRLEDLLLRFARFATGAQVERIVRDFRRTEVHHQQDPACDRRAFDWVREDGMIDIRIRLPQEDGLAVIAALEHEAGRQADASGRAATTAGQDPDPAADDGVSLRSPAPVPRSARLADALVAAAEALTSTTASDRSGADLHTLVIHTRADDLADPGPGADRQVQVRVRAGRHQRQPAMSARVLRSMACQARFALVAHDGEGDEVGVSGTTTRIPSRLRRLVVARDSGCRFPGCQAAGRRLQCHHIIHWADGGPTTLANLVLLCPFHHTFVHKREWSILHDGAGRFRFAPPGEVPRLTVLPLPGASAEAPGGGDHLDPSVLQPAWDGSTPDYSACVAALQQQLDKLEAPRAA